MQCLVGSLLWQEILGDQFVLKKNEKKQMTFLLGKIVFVCVSPKNQIAC